MAQQGQSTNINDQIKVLLDQLASLDATIPSAIRFVRNTNEKLGELAHVFKHTGQKGYLNYYATAFLIEHKAEIEKELKFLIVQGTKAIKEINDYINKISDLSRELNEISNRDAGEFAHSNILSLNSINSLKIKNAERQLAHCEELVLKLTDYGLYSVHHALDNYRISSLTEHGVSDKANPLRLGYKLNQVVSFFNVTHKLGHAGFWLFLMLAIGDSALNVYLDKGFFSPISIILTLVSGLHGLTALFSGKYLKSTAPFLKITNKYNKQL